MGKRGPKPDPEFGDQKTVLSTRISQETRDALEAAAKANGRPLSREIERRLRRSFEDDQKIIDTLGGPQLYAMLRMVAEAMNLAGTIRGDGNHADWLNKPDAYDRALWATIRVLDALRPVGEMAGASDQNGAAGWAERRRDYGISLADLVIDRVAEAPPVIASPREKLTPRQRLYRRIASDLGAAHERIKGARFKGEEK